jgi:hypothetical protein
MIDWYDEEDVTAKLLMDAAMCLIIDWLSCEFVETAIGRHERDRFEALAQEERGRIMRDNALYEALPKLHVDWENPEVPRLYFQKTRDEAVDA